MASVSLKSAKRGARAVLYHVDLLADSRVKATGWFGRSLVSLQRLELLSVYLKGVAMWCQADGQLVEPQRSLKKIIICLEVNRVVQQLGMCE